jgi:hypothetical protein
MCVAGDELFVAGPADVVDERYAYRNPDVPDVRTLLARQEEAYAGRQGGNLWVVDKNAGNVVARYAIDSIPVFDGMSTANGRLYVSDVEGNVTCYTATGLQTLRSLEGQPIQTMWDEPEDPKYLLPLPEPKEGDFTVVRGASVTASDLGYRLRANSQDAIAIALKKLDKPITGTVTFRLKMKPVQDAQGLLRNGFLVFGSSGREPELVKCGMRFQPQQATIIEGSLKGAQKPLAGAAVDAPDATGLEAVVTVNLDAQSVTYIANGVEIKAELSTPLEEITHVGYANTGALIDLTQIYIEH